MRMHCRHETIIKTDYLKRISPLMNALYQVYGKCMDGLALGLMREELYEHDVEDCDFENTCLEDILEKFEQDVDKVKNEVRMLTGLEIELGYHYSEFPDCDIADGHYWSVNNAYVKNPKLDDSLFEEMVSGCLIEEYD